VDEAAIVVACEEYIVIDKDELEALRRLAQELLGLAPSAFHTAVRAGELHEVNDDEKDEVGDS
jgi:hypothetical protein